MGKRLVIIIQNAPYRADNKAWHALRLAGWIDESDQAPTF